MRIPEMCAGDFFHFIEQLCAQTSAVLLLELVADINPPLEDEQKAFCMRVFEQGRSHLVFTFVLKLGAFQDPPLLICGGAHWEREKSVRCVKLRLGYASKHPRILRWQTPPLMGRSRRVYARIGPERFAFVANIHCRVAVWFLRRAPR